jgi:hypothetical protein
VSPFDPTSLRIPGSVHAGDVGGGDAHFARESEAATR